jgi:hypothetical protein
MLHRPKQRTSSGSHRFARRWFWYSCLLSWRLRLQIDQPNMTEYVRKKPSKMGTRISEAELAL